MLSISRYGQGPDLILIHGWGWGSSIWQTLIPYLTYRVHVVHLPNQFTNLPDLSRQIIELCPNPAIWLGWSLGGLIALQAAFDYPQQVKKLILVASSPCFIKKNNWPGIDIIEFEELYSLFEKNPARAIKKFIGLQTHFNHVLMKKLIANHQPTTYCLHGLTLLKNTDFTPNLEQLHCPCLAILGAYDQLIPIALAQQLTHYSAMTIEIFQSGHLPFYTDPKLFSEIINV